MKKKLATKMSQMSPEEKVEDYKKRVGEFLKELEPLMSKYSVGLSAELQVMTNGIIAKPVFPDKKFTE